MGFKKVSGKRNYFKYKECAPGQVLVKEGTYIGPEQGKYGVQHVFKIGDEMTVLNSSGHLNWLIDNFLDLGQRCNVVYAGSTTLTKGPMMGKEAHNFELEVEEKEGSPLTKITDKPEGVPAGGKAVLQGLPEDDIALT